MTEPRHRAFRQWAKLQVLERGIPSHDEIKRAFEAGFAQGQQLETIRWNDSLMEIAGNLPDLFMRELLGKYNKTEYRWSDEADLEDK